MSTSPKQSEKRIYWHRDLPPLDAEIEGEHFLDAASEKVPYHFDRRDQLWVECHPSLVSSVETRIDQEITRLGGRCAHIVDEDIEPSVNNGAGLYHLKGKFTYLLYR